MPASSAPTKPRSGRSTTRTTARGRIVAPILARHLRNGIEESVHRGDIVEADANGRVLRQLGDPDRLVTLRSTVKPFGLLALIEAGGIAAFDLEPAELAVLASSHSGEDMHVRTLQAIYRRSGVSQALLACGSEGAPLDALTAARLARDGEKAGPVRHMCSGQHTVSLLLSRLHGWDATDYWKPNHPSQIAYRAAVAHGLRHDARQAADRDRRLRRRDVRVPAARDRACLRDAGRSHRDPDGRPASRARGVARDRS